MAVTLSKKLSANQKSNFNGKKNKNLIQNKKK